MESNSKIEKQEKNDIQSLKAETVIENHDKETQEIADDLYEHFNFVVDKGQSLLRIDKFLFSHIQNVSRNKIQQAAKAGNILVNGASEKQNYKVKPLDLISVLMSHPLRDIEIVPEDIPLDIVYEDDDILIVNKKAGMVTHPAYGNYNGTLVNALSYYLGEKYNEDGSVQNPLLVHRIDKDTSGILIVAKNEFAQAKLSYQFYFHTINRKYHALVWGDFKEDEGTIDSYINRSHADRRVMECFSDPEKGKHAITHWKVLERFGYVTLVECRLETGRTHQIRAQMKSIGHPLFSDYTYGGRQIVKGTVFTKYKQFVNNAFKLLPRQGLHAKSLGFIHPVTEEKMFFDSELPQDMQDVIEKWRKYAIHKNYEETTDTTMDV
ncbi:MAG: RluA family pseudouridine synthase [Bacteroidales bacterium]|nr:RluA family pseudouridine synthase [Bacteroidales bacterium]MDD4209191.1 RluA family pseudouridine synthase [Bacteroidales bacterium]